ncbi:hypothetical protein DL767_000362 [Monosporascus sp. MG133]|nr:hypothetical protein DL767_000362 [Monosporascus sp. MG133]
MTMRQQDLGAAKASPWARLHSTAKLSLLGNAAVIVACVGFLGFLWYGTPDNQIWSYIILSNWATRAITLTSILLRIAVAAHCGLCVSVMAAVALERSAVPLPCVGSVSMMRATGDTGMVPTWTDFVWPLLRWGPRQDQLIIPTLVLILTSMALSQFTSTALMADVVLQQVPGYNETVRVAYDFGYNNTGIMGYPYKPLTSRSLWAAGVPAQWPMFAEYSEPPIVQDNVSDTGLSLRAFLPLGTQERHMIRNYTGKALVLDSRTTCQPPVFTDLEWVTEDKSRTYLKGLVGPSTPTPRLDATGMVNFSCEVSPNVWSICEPPNWAIHISGEAPFSGGLVSEFRDLPSSQAPGQNKSGAALLIITSLRDRSADAPTWEAEKRPEFVSISSPTIYGLAVSLCYTSFDVANRWIDAYGSTNRTEPTLSWGADDKYNMTAVTPLLDTGYTSASRSSAASRSAEERGIMHFSRPTNWSAPQSAELFNDGPALIPPNPYYLTDVNALPCLSWRLHQMQSLGTYGLGFSSLSNYSFRLGTPDSIKVSPNGGVSDSSDAWLTDLFMHFFQESSTSGAIQAVITALAGIEYYARMGQYDKFDNVSTVYFVNAISPGGPFGERRTATPWGLGAVVVFLVCHLVLTATVMARFWAQTTLSHIGDGWQALAHVALSSADDLKTRLGWAARYGSERGADGVDNSIHFHIDNKEGVVAVSEVERP